MRSYMGLSPEEMIYVFNAIYLEVWEKTKNNIHWDQAKITQQIKEGKNVDLGRLLLEMFEVVMTAARDSFITVMYHNNEKIWSEMTTASAQAALANETKDTSQQETEKPAEGSVVESEESKDMEPDVMEPDAV
jgi:hypothetical protein